MVSACLPSTLLQGVDTGFLMVPDKRLEEKKASGAGPAAVRDVLQAAFKRERQLHADEDDPHM